MTESEWLACSDPKPMLAFLTGQVSERRLRLFAVACCRQIPHLLSDGSRRAVAVAERYADGSATEQERAAAFVAPGDDFPADAACAAADVNRPWVDAGLISDEVAWAGAEHALRSTYGAVPAVLRPLERAGRRAKRWVGERAVANRAAALAARKSAQVPLLRDIVGNPFRPAAPDPPWVTPAILSLARTIYDDHAFNRMPELADLLDKAGCTDKDVLEHCRSGGPHVRGCWLIDLILGKT